MAGGMAGSCVQQYEAADEEALEQKPWMQDFLSYMKCGLEI